MKNEQNQSMKEVAENIRKFLFSGFEPEKMKNEIRQLFNPQILEMLNLNSGNDEFQPHLSQFRKQIQNGLNKLEEVDFQKRIFEKDGTLWPDSAEAARFMNWISLPETMHDKTTEIRNFVEEIKEEGFKDIVLLGMGGSSLCAYVFRDLAPMPAVFGFHVADTTHPEEIKKIEDKIDIGKTLFIVASKSGGTAEVQALMSYFRDKVEKENIRSGNNFISITDPGTLLEKQSKEFGFRKIFYGDPGVGGRFSVLSPFGLIPAAFMGWDIDLILDKAGKAMQKIQTYDLSENPAIYLGAILGTFAGNGREKMILGGEKEFHSFHLWIEQLVAESTGKQGKGVLPVILANDDQNQNSDDRFYVNTWLFGKDKIVSDKNLNPSVDIIIRDTYDIAAEFYNWEIATATACWFLQVNPFDQPNVQENKKVTEAILKDLESGELIDIELPAIGKQFRMESSMDTDDIGLMIRSLMRKSRSDNYLVIQSYLQESEENLIQLENLADIINTWTGTTIIITTGPRFLHSTGQYHKGGTENGLFIQLTETDKEKVMIPGRSFGFGDLINAQARGDYETLIKKGKHILHAEMNGPEGLKNFVAMFDKAFTEFNMEMNHTE